MGNIGRHEGKQDGRTKHNRKQKGRDHRDFRVSSRSICPKSSWCPDYSLIVSLPVYKIHCHPMLTWHVLGAGKVLQVASFELVVFGIRLEFSFCIFKNMQTGDKKWVTQTSGPSLCLCRWKKISSAPTGSGRNPLGQTPKIVSLKRHSSEKPLKYVQVWGHITAQ